MVFLKRGEELKGNTRYIRGIDRWDNSHTNGIIRAKITAVASKRCRNVSA